jgi:hypothetical protein
MSNYDPICEQEHVVQANENVCPYCEIDSKDELITQLNLLIRCARKREDHLSLALEAVRRRATTKPEAC